MKPSNGSILIISGFKELTDHPHNDNEFSNDWNEFVCGLGGGGDYLQFIIYITSCILSPSLKNDKDHNLK